MTAPHQNLLGTSGAIDTEETDPNFNQTVLLLHGDGTNGGQNNTFVDSTGVHSLTRQSNPTQGTFNPFLGDGQYSNFFDANADYLRIASSSDFVMGTGNFTIEFFAYFLDAGAGGFVTVESTGGMAFYYTGSYFTLSARGSGQTEYVKYTHTPALNTWHHIAVCRSGTGSNETALFFNGSRVAQSTNDLDYTVQAVLDIGDIGAVTGYDFNGYLSNLRIVKGSSVYDTSSSSITVPSTALTAIPNTKLLTCQSNRFVDNSTSGHTISINGTPKVVPFSPLAPTASYSESVHGGSGFFDGTNDYFTITDSPDFTFGSNNFTLALWVYRTSASSATEVAFANTGGDSYTSWLFSSTKFYATTNGSSWNIAITYSSVVPCNEWVYVQVNRVGNVYTVYHNGVSVGTTTVAGSLYNISSAFEVGYRNGAGYMDGYMSNFIITNGGNLTSTNVPTSLNTADSNTKLLLNFTNASIIDSTMKNNLETVDDAQIDTSIKKFGTGSVELDGTNDEVRSPAIHSTLYDIGSAQFTIEFFVYRRGTTQQTLIMLGTGNGNTTNFSLNFFWSTVSSTSKLKIYNAGTSLNLSAGDLAINQWVYLVLQRDTSNMSVYVDGTRSANFAESTTFSNLNRVSLGSHLNGGNHLNGLLDSIRVTRGVARYSGTSMTVPTKSHPNK